MDNFITITDYDASIHREILDSLVREDTTCDSAVVEICEDRAVEEMRSYLYKFYDCDAIFNARGKDRHPLILMMALDIAIYHLFCIHNPYKLSDIRKERYERACAWLKAVSRAEVVIDGAPRRDAEETAAGSAWTMDSDTHRETHL